MDVTLSVNHRCNLRCTYCYGGEKFHRAMPLAVAERALDLGFSSPGPLLRVLFFGGEPLLEPGLIEQVATAAQARAAAEGRLVRLGLTTNGTLLTGARLAMLERHGVDVTVSLDGDELAHDAARVLPDGGGTWSTVVGNTRRALAQLGKVTTLSVVHPGNVDRLASSFDFVSSLGVRRLAFNLNYDAPWDDAALARYEAALAALADRVIARYRGGDDFTVQPFHAKIISRLKGGFVDGDRCDFGCQELAVAPSGRIYPCDRLIGEDGEAQGDMVIGHVESGVDPARVAALKAPKDTAKPSCDGCDYLDRCMWWCGCVNRALTGRVDAVSGLLCRVEQAVIREADRLASTLFAEGNRAFLGRYYLAATTR